MATQGGKKENRATALFCPMHRLETLYHTLEFPRVLNDLAGRAHCPASAKRLLNLKPLNGLDAVQQSLDQISEIRTFMDSGGTVPMVRFDDIRDALRIAEVEESRLEPAAFVKIHNLLVLAGHLDKFFRQHQDDLPMASALGAALIPCPAVVKAIEKAIDVQAVVVRDTASTKLAAVRREKARAQEQVRRQLESLISALAKKGVLQERFITERSGRWVIPVKETHRHLVPGILHDRSASGATAFVEPLQTLELNNRIRRLEAEERDEVEKVLRILTGEVRTALGDLNQDLDTLISLDCLIAKALCSQALHAHAPALNDKGLLRIKNGRHPVLIFKQTPTTHVVPLTLSLGEDGVCTLVVTGPNAGGKTVALKTIGVLALMAACGLHIPADADSEVPVFKHIFAHVGDAQSIENDLSTFSAHLSDLKQIVQLATAGDLVLVDEIGTGTDPQEGAALAMAVLEELTTRGVMTVVTTHHGTLKAFAHETPAIANGSMAFDRKTLAPTYKFRADLPGSSYALEIAERMGLSDGLVARAKALLGPETIHLEELAQHLSAEIDRYRELKSTLDVQNKIVERLRETYEKDTARLKSEQKRLRQQAARQAKAIVDEANAAVEKAIRTIREQGASKQAICESKAIIEKQRAALEAETQDLQK
ncbi:MAG: endonuclease MutS2, partial [Deltaproteobacteria bacterium]|nr:endonuclease MutS2 [Deltaproteobacteria bacterium]